MTILEPDTTDRGGEEYARSLGPVWRQNRIRELEAELVRLKSIDSGAPRDSPTQ